MLQSLYFLLYFSLNSHQCLSILVFLNNSTFKESSSNVTFSLLFETETICGDLKPPLFTKAKYSSDFFYLKYYFEINFLKIKYSSSYHVRETIDARKMCNIAFIILII